MFLKLLSISVAMLGMVSCSSIYRAECAKGALAGYKSASVTVMPEYSGDSVVKDSLEAELRKRGLTVTTVGLGERREGKKMEVKFGDTWYWDIVMYLISCEVAILDADTKELKATVHYRNSPLHQYPSRRKVAQRLFEALDKKGAFSP